MIEKNVPIKIDENPFHDKNEHLMPACISLRYLINELYSNLSDMIVSSQDESKLLQLINKLPFKSAGLAIAEYNLTNISLPDISVNIDPSYPCDEQLIVEMISVPSFVNDNSLWNRIIAFVKRWEKLNTDFNNIFRDFWFEFDMPQFQTSDILLPCLFININCPSLKGCSEKNTFSNVFEIIIRSITENNIPGTTRSLINNVLEAVSPDTNIWGVGIMLPRNPNNIRLCIMMRLVEIPDFLTRLGKECDNRIHQIVTALHDKWDRVSFDIDIDQKIGDRIGIEFFCRDHSDHKSSANIELFDFIESICGDNAIKYIHALREIPHSFREAEAEQICPLEKSLPCRWADLKNYAFTGINHIKLVLTPEKPVEIKVYFYTEHCVDLPVNCVPESSDR